ncbi:hypothetical protein FE251_01900 [Georgenia wutianyii]|uniref:Helix-turn-helix domain-containing protein n=1 Tax=Georgenia wutianyii TaxID=2585135 RepID=A0ABX5VNY7_9MICO|nr:hypothetical protein [Georgenia wutianyii]QDB78265.1 hypothetical protein FE251_01900 [Georgenia wutianyii]
MTNYQQWSVLGGAPDVLKLGLNEVETALGRAASMPPEVYEHAPGAYTVKTLEQLQQAQRWLQWTVRVLADEALTRETASRRGLAEAAGVAFTTVQKWSREPILEGPEGELGPAMLPDGRRRK